MTKPMLKKSGFLPHERKWMTDTLASGWRDALRVLYPELEIYSWWSNRSRQAREKNVGWRIDYQLMSKKWGAPTAVEILESPNCQIMHRLLLSMIWCYNESRTAHRETLNHE